MYTVRITDLDDHQLLGVEGLSYHGCDRECKSCPLFKICGSFGSLEVHGFRCPFFGCELKEPAFKKMRGCDVCRYGDKLSWNLNKEEVLRLVNQVMNLGKVNNPKLVLPGIIPLVSLREPATYVWDSLKLDTIIVGCQELFDGELLAKVVKAGGIHDYLNFKGKVIISTIMPDDYLTREDTFNYFTRLFKWCGFDAAIAWDAPVYIDIPLYDSWINLLKGIVFAHKLVLEGIPVIGLIKGNSERQIEFSARTLSQAGIRTLALHASEYMMKYKFDSVARQILYMYFQYMDKWADSMLIIGALSPSSLSYIQQNLGRRSNLSVAGLSWFLDARRGKLYSNKGSINSTERFVGCTCTVCSQIKPRDLMANLDAKSSHNLNYLIHYFNGTEFPDVKTYHLILEEEEKALLVSDLHLWMDNGLLDEFITFVKGVKPDYLIFLGDTFNLESGWKGTQNYPATNRFFKALRGIEIPILVVRGCSDSSRKRLLQSLDAFVMGGVPKSLLWKQTDDPSHYTTYLDLYKFYRSSKKQLVIKLVGKWSIVVMHGHEIVQDPSIPVKGISKLMEDERMKVHAHWLVMGHVHKAFVDDERRVASTGCWVRDGLYREANVRKKDVKTAVVIQGDGSVKLLRKV